VSKSSFRERTPHRPPGGLLRRGLRMPVFVCLRMVRLKEIFDCIFFLRCHIRRRTRLEPSESGVWEFLQNKPVCLGMSHLSWGVSRQCAERSEKTGVRGRIPQEARRLIFWGVSPRHPPSRGSLRSGLCMSRKKSSNKGSSTMVPPDPVSELQRESSKLSVDTKCLWPRLK
jgi:hypothetical protein